MITKLIDDPRRGFFQRTHFSQTKDEKFFSSLEEKRKQSDESRLRKTDEEISLAEVSG
jgi:hypothetical protein